MPRFLCRTTLARLAGASLLILSLAQSALAAGPPGSLVGTLKLASGLHGGPALADGDTFGTALAVLGDLNHDGVPDLAIGADADSTGGPNRGAVYVAFMRADGTISSTVKLADSTNGGPALQDYAYFGNAVAALGDLNHDGVPDLAIGSFCDPTCGQRPGAVYVAFMKADGTISSTVKLANGLNGAPALADGDQFGSALAPLGDINHDGVPDLAIGAYGDATGGLKRGAVYVALMKTDGTISSTVKLANNTNRGPALADFDGFGSALAAPGDLNHDGVPDLAIGAYGDAGGGSARGAVYVALMQADGTIGSLVKLASSLNGGPALADGDSFGSAVAALGDVNGDGVPDLAIGAPFDSTSGSGGGAVYVALLNADGTIRQSVKLADNTNGGPALASSDQFGGALAALGDWNHDGVPDLAIGAPFDSTGGAGRGAVYLAWLQPNATLGAVGAGPAIKLASGTHGGPALANGDHFGDAVTEIGDLNHDGVPDLAIGAGSDSTGGTRRGAVYVAFMHADGTISNTVKLASGLNGAPALADNDGFGDVVAALGDWNHDGVPDLAIGAQGDSTGGALSGAVYVALMKSDGTISRTVKLASSLNGGPVLTPFDLFGSAVTVLGDLNHDGVPDLAIGAFGDSTGGVRRGAVYVALMRADGTIGSVVKLASGLNGSPALANEDLFGSALATPGDLNHDGVPDLVIGALFDSTGGLTHAGAVYVAFMNADGTMRHSVKLANNTNGGPALANNDEFGNAVAAIGDANRDGVPDLAIGAPGDSTGGLWQGAVYVTLMNADGTIGSLVKLASGQHGAPVLAGSDAFGSAVAGLGDWNHDGLPDLAVGAHDDATGGPYRGAVYVAPLIPFYPLNVPVVMK